MAFLSKDGLIYAWSKIKAYIDNGLNNKAPTNHTHTAADVGAAAASHSHSYNDLSDKPTIPEAYTHPATHPASMITGLADVATSGSYDDLTDKPTIPAAYTHPESHPASMITGLATVATTGKYTDLTDTPTIPTTVAQLSDAANYALRSELTNVYKYKGSVATVDDLPTNADNGDVYDVQANGANYAWNGTAWDNLGGSFSVESITNAEIDAIIV